MNTQKVWNIRVVPTTLWGKMQPRHRNIFIKKDTETKYFVISLKKKDFKILQFDFLRKFNEYIELLTEFLMSFMWEEKLSLELNSMPMIVCFVLKTTTNEVEVACA